MSIENNINNNEETELSTTVVPAIKTIEKDDRIYKMISDRKEKFLPLVDNNNSQLEKLARSFIFCLHKNDLTQLNAHSIMEGFIKCCELNLDPANGLGKLYLLDYKGSLNVQVGYQGWLELLWRSPLVVNVYSNAVYEGDHFEVKFGVNTTYDHQPKYISDILKLTYAVVKLKSGNIQIKVASLKEIQESKKASLGSNSPHSPWNKYYDSMAQIVPMRKIAKNLALAIRQDDEFASSEEKLEEEKLI